MTLDVWLVSRLALELRDGISGARIQTVASDAAGLRLACYRRGGTASMRATFDADGPLLAIHADGDSENENAAGGWAGGVAPLLRGCSVESVQAVPNDRIILVDVVSRSAFGVPARHRLAFELEPNKSNILVLRQTDRDRWQILAAAKEIEGAQGARDVLVGHAYEPPPPRRRRLDRAEFRSAVTLSGDGDARGIARLLGELDPACSPALARETIERAGADARCGDLALRLLEAWETIRSDLERSGADLRAPVYAWRQGDGYRVCHLLPLLWPPGKPEEFSSLNDVCARQQLAGDRRRRAPAVTALRKRLAIMLDRCDVEMASLQRAQERGERSDEDRIAGESIYTYLAEIPDRSTEFVTPGGVRVALDPALSAKENAAAYFRRFKKARSGLPRIVQRLAVLQANRVHWEELLWELERAQAAPLDELVALTDEIAEAIGHRRGGSKQRRTRQLRGRSVELPGGAVAHVGRSPKDNERVTFSVAAPDDLWFHARGVPGAHVVLKPADARALPSDEQILAAAALAAGQSKAADANKVEVDYTPRKHVRKQGGGRVGLVWYTDFKTVRVSPRKL